MQPSTLLSFIILGALTAVVGAKDAHQTGCNPPDVECRAASPTAAVEAREENLWVGANWVLKRSNAPDFLKARAPMN
ncbi:hypothetical protein C8T65DRAFT_667181 [Cerioporus squamosus]|nr:hypothetical protein C8T65DRAFT_667181 [Cerioporus squamosus]